MGRSKHYKYSGHQSTVLGAVTGTTILVGGIYALVEIFLARVPRGRNAARP